MDIAQDNAAVLEFCLREINRREMTDLQYSWLWHIKEKIARYALKILYMKGQSSGQFLTEEQKDQILQHHPLLENRHTSFGSISRELPKHIRDEVHHKVQSFMESSCYGA